MQAIRGERSVASAASHEPADGGLVLIDDYELDMNCPQCHPGSESWIATVTTVANLCELMPYVNAVVARGEFIPGVPTLVWRDGANKIFLRSHQLGISNLRDRSQAQREVSRIVQFLNETWNDRENIAPDFSTRSKPKMFEILKFLPARTAASAGSHHAWHTPPCSPRATQASMPVRHSSLLQRARTARGWSSSVSDALDLEASDSR